MKEVTQEVYLKWYEDAFGESEDKLAALYIQQKVRGFYIYNGQEAVLGALHAMDLTKIE
jgi:hypothetical protein